VWKLKEIDGKVWYPRDFRLNCFGKAYWREGFPAVVGYTGMFCPKGGACLCLHYTRSIGRYKRVFNPV